MKESHKARPSLGVSSVFIIVVSIAFIISLFCVTFYLISKPSSPESGPEQQSLRAVIVDQLGIYSPNQTFIDTTTAILAQAGYTIDYFAWNKITVDFFRNLPQYNYTLIVLRTHSAVVQAEPNYVCIFTSENFSDSKYTEEWTAGRLGKARLFSDEARYYFAITPKFISHSMRGTFRNATVIMMGCEGLKYMNMAEAFIGKGAEVYISWDGPVSTSHTDTATSNLLSHLVTEEQTLSSAVAETIQEVGADPIYLANLAFYPRERS